MRRRDFVALVAGTLAMGSVKALAQSSTHRPLIAVLLGGSQTTVQRWLGGLPDELQSLGYVEHRNFEAEYRYADGDLSRLPRLAAELASLNPDVIVVASTAAAMAAKRAAEHPDCRRGSHQPGPFWSCQGPCPTRRQCHGDAGWIRRAGRKTAGTWLAIASRQETGWNAG